MDAAALFISSIPSILDRLRRIAAYMWAEDKTYIMAFLVFVLICSFLNSLIKKKHPF